ncbi:MAG: hypothetical protein ACM31L_07310 [Actinomycetota bacterium]
MATTCPHCRYWALQQCCHALAKRSDGRRPGCLFFVDEDQLPFQAERPEPQSQREKCGQL